MPDVATEKERIDTEIGKLHTQRVEASLKMQNEVKVWLNWYTGEFWTSRKHTSEQIMLV